MTANTSPMSPNAPGIVLLAVDAGLCMLSSGSWAVRADGGENSSKRCNPGRGCEMVDEQAILLCVAQRMVPGAATSCALFGDGQCRCRVEQAVDLRCGDGLR